MRIQFIILIYNTCLSNIPYLQFNNKLNCEKQAHLGDFVLQQDEKNPTLGNKIT